MSSLPYFSCKSSPLVYLNMPKSGCTTIRNIMFFLDNNKWLKNPLRIHHNSKALLGGKTHPQEIQKILNSGDSFNFTFIRKPDKRIYSCFLEKICQNSSEQYIAVRNRIADAYGLRFDEKPELDLLNHRRNFLAFLDFVDKNLAGSEKIRGRGHWQRQSTIIDVRETRYPLHFVGLVERMTPHFNHVLREARINVVLSNVPQFNESTVKSAKYEDIADDEVRNAVKAVFRSDFSLYEDVENRTRHIM